MKSLGILDKEKTALLVIDIQEKLVPVVQNSDALFANANKLIKGFEVLKLPIIVTEQYPKGLGNTCKEIELPTATNVIEKISFSCLLSSEVNNQLQEKKITTLILCGAEAHICVFKTALNAIQLGYEVHVVADAISSRTQENKAIAIERLKQSGVFVASTEMILFQLIDEAGTETFKTISKIIK